jgi:prephenate dehydrogenase
MKTMQVNVTIVGLDRLSASFGLAIKRYERRPKTEHQFTITGSDAKPNLLKAAEQVGAVDRTERSIDKALRNADVVIMNAPFGQLEAIYANMGPELKPGTVVLDLALLKQPVIAWAERYFSKNAQGAPLAYLVGITPIVGYSALYSSGIDVEDARDDLFDGAEILIAPDPKCPGQAISLAEDIAGIVGGRPRFIDPAEHDGLVASTEGLSAVLGAGLFYMLQRSDGWIDLRRMINPALASHIQNLRYQSDKDLLAFFTHNRANLALRLQMLMSTLDDLRGALTDPEGDDKLEALLARVQTEWEKWDLKRQTGNWEDSPVPDATGGVMNGLMGGLLGGFGRRKPDQDE